MKRRDGYTATVSVNGSEPIPMEEFERRVGNLVRAKRKERRVAVEKVFNARIKSDGSKFTLTLTSTETSCAGEGEPKHVEKSEQGGEFGVLGSVTKAIGVALERWQRAVTEDNPTGDLFL